MTSARRSRPCAASSRGGRRLPPRTSVAAVEDLGDVGQADDREAAGVGAEADLDPRRHLLERQRIGGTAALADGDAGLADPPQAFLDQQAVALMEGLVAADEQRRRSAR